MEEALYDPARGYYPRRTPTEDFYTAPELHPAFAGVLARHILERLQALRKAGVPPPYSVVEMGSGSGLLARQVLSHLRTEAPAWAARLRYVMVERCRETLLKSVSSVPAGDWKVLGCTGIEDVQPCAGVFFSNELVDAFPVHLLEKRDGEVWEVYVEGAGRTRLGRLSREELKACARAVSPSLSEGERHTVNLEARSWLKAVAARLKAGWIVTVDYGKRYGSAAANPARAYRRHSQVDDLSRGPGSKDITAPVDFEALIDEGRRCGLRVESYSTLARFLLEGGIEEWLAREGGNGASSYSSRARIKTLLHPEGMGETFKVLIQKREPGSAETPGAPWAERTHRWGHG